MLALFFCFVLPLGLPAFDDKIMVSEISSLRALLPVELHPVDGDEMDEILGSFCVIANSSTGLAVLLG